MAFVLTDRLCATLDREIAKNIQETLGRNDVSLEIEARFRNVTPDVFDDIVKLFSEKITPIVTRTIDTNEGDFRRTVQIGENGEESVSYMQKRRLWFEDDEEFGVRIQLSRETQFGNQPPRYQNNRSGQVVIRDKMRTSFVLLGSRIRLDATKVRMQIDNRDQTKYELELEVLDIRNYAGAFRAAIGSLIQLIQQSDIPISRSEHEAVIAYIAELISDKQNPRLDLIESSQLVQSRDLKIRDMVFGGVIGNKETNYSITDKADGERKLLAFTPWGVFFAQAPKRLNKISNTDFSLLTGTILDGEYIPDESRKPGGFSTRHVWLAFDCICNRGDKQIRQRPHFERLSVCKEVTDQPDSMVSGASYELPKATLRTKTFLVYNTVEEFFTRMAEMFLRLDTLPYENDGFMLTPTHSPYLPSGIRQSTFIQSTLP
jgi:hypothetical protein